MPSRSADAMRANSRRRSERAIAIARTGSLCRPAEATNAPATAPGSTSSSFGSRRPVAVVLDHLRCAHQQLGHIRRGAEHMHQSLGHRRLVAQRRQIPALRDHHLADPAVGQQPAIGIRGVGKPIQQPGQQNRLHAAAPAALVDQRGEVRQRAVRSFVAECGQLPFRGRRRHPLARIPGLLAQAIPAAVGRTTSACNRDTLKWWRFSSSRSTPSRSRLPSGRT